MATDALPLEQEANAGWWRMVQDNDSHWYIIPAEMSMEWQQFCDIPADDEASWEVPEWARRINGPHNITFRDGWSSDE